MFARPVKGMSQGTNFLFFVSGSGTIERWGLRGVCSSVVRALYSTHGNGRLCISQKLCRVLLEKQFLLRI